MLQPLRAGDQNQVRHLLIFPEPFLQSQNSVSTDSKFQAFHGNWLSTQKNTGGKLFFLFPVVTSSWAQTGSSLTPAAQESLLQGSALGNQIMESVFKRDEIKSNSYGVSNLEVQHSSTSPSRGPCACWPNALVSLGLPGCATHCSWHLFQKLGPSHQSLAVLYKTGSHDAAAQKGAAQPVNWGTCSLHMA